MLCSGYKGLVALGVLVTLAACAGNGNGLDANGQPIGPTGNETGGSGGGSGGITADFQSIQDNVFTPICTHCHLGASAPEGLQLDAANSYAMLVGVPSNEKPGTLRVKAGDATNSYIFQKITGAAGIVGGQMPLGGPPLPQASIDAIQQWIANGAMKAAAATNVNAKAALSRTFTVTTTSPGNNGVISAPVAAIVVAFNRDVDSSLLNSTTIDVESLADFAGNASGGTAGASPVVGAVPTPIAFSAAPADANPSSLVIRPTHALEPGMYRVTVRGTGGGAVADMNGQPLGQDFSFEFTVSPAT